MTDTAATFAANRAVGNIALAVKMARGTTQRARVREDGSLRVRCPGARAAELEAVIVNTAGGMAGGDRFTLDFAVEPAARLLGHHRGGREGLPHARSRRRPST